jgi:uracil-DNA glycosylase
MTRCSRCANHRPPVLPSGPSPCRLLLIGERPSYREDELGECFVGKTGAELENTYLPILGLPRSAIHICNSVYCSAYDYANPEPADALACMNVHLGPLLQIVEPEIIVPMGAIACSLWPEINLNLDHGLPMVGRWGAWSGVLWPSFHPSAGLHSTSYMIPLQADFHNLRKFLGKLDGYSL